MSITTVVVETPITTVITVPNQTTVEVVPENSTLVVDNPVNTVLTVGQQGPAGPQGAIGPAGGEAMTVTAGAALGGHRVVYIDAAEKAQYADNQTSTHALVALGLTLGAANLNDPVDVQRLGLVTEPSWNWSLFSPVYLDTNGLMTQTPPANPALFQRIVGFPLSATRLYISFREPVFIL